MTKQKLHSTNWYKLQEIVILSLNIVYIKDTIQAVERMKAKLSYMGIATGPIQVTYQELLDRRRSLTKRTQRHLGEFLNSGRQNLPYIFSIDKEYGWLTKKQLEKGYALFTNIRDMTYALDLRTGTLYPVTNPESEQDPIIRTLEYNAQHVGPVYDLYNIDTTDPLKDKLRY